MILGILFHLDKEFFTKHAEERKIKVDSDTADG
jgi:hypothetical protein